MLRFRLGQAWKHESHGPDGPLDAFRLQVADVDLLEDANEEPLAEVVPRLIHAASVLRSGEEALAQVTLPHRGLELCLTRVGPDAVELVLLDMGRPAKLLREPLRLDLHDWISAAVACGRALQQDLTERSQGTLNSSAWKTAIKALPGLETGHVADWPTPYESLAWEQFPHAAAPVGFRLRDDLGRLTAFHRKSAAPLTSLLCAGELVTVDGRQLSTLPFVWLFEATRRAPDEAWEDPDLGTIDSRSVCTAGLSFGLAVKTFNPRLAHNSWLAALLEQCTRGLAHHRTTGTRSHRTKRTSRARAAASLPAPTPPVGTLRRLSFSKQWERELRIHGETGSVILSRRGPIVTTPFVAQAFDAKGRSLFRRVGTHGVAANKRGQVLVANASRLTMFRGTERSARWLRNHDGRTLGTALEAMGDVFLESTRTHGLIAHAAFTGKEAWRLEPGRIVNAFPLVTPSRVYLATDDGTFYSVSLEHGDWAFRLRSPLPFAHPPLLVGRHLMGVLTQGERTAIFWSDAQSGAIKWAVESRLFRPTPLCAAKGVAYLAGERDGAAWVVAIDSQARVLWERPLPSLVRPRFVGHHPQRLWVVDHRGAAVGLSKAGQPDWLLGAAHEGAVAELAPRLVGDLLLLPVGDTVRAIAPATGRVIAELALPATATGFEVDAKLNLYVIDERGVLTAYRLGTQLSVV